MAETRDVWDKLLRVQLYAILTWQFGPLRYWQAKSRPYKSGGAFQEFLNKTAEHFHNIHGHELTPDAIKSQLNYVLQRPAKASFNIGHKDNFKRNVAAAVKAGFITLDELRKRLKGGGEEEQDSAQDRARTQAMQRGRKPGMKQ